MLIKTETFIGVSEELSRSEHAYVLPPFVQPDHVLGLVEAINNLTGTVDPMYLGDLLGEKIDLLPHVIDVASHLGLIEVLENGNVRLTQLGKEIADGDVQIVKERMRRIIDKIEPFRTIIKVLRRKKRITVEEFMEIAERFYPYNTTKAVKTILEWGAFAELFRMSPDDEYVFITQQS